MPELSSLIDQAPSPERARNGVEAWLRVSGAPDLYTEQLKSSPELALGLFKLLGSSQAMCDFIVQNPEFPNILFERANPTLLASRGEIEELGRQILSGAISYQHSLDRLRYLHQRILFQIALVDVNDWQPAPLVWRALSDLADAVLVLTHEVAWQNHRRVRGLDIEPCPLQIIAFGKHGGQEVNYSSDLDLVFVLEDGLDERTERESIRFAESLIRAFTDRMGRGALYRIDMRLRPYGAAGELAKSMRATENYYKLYAEAWEAQALIRSRVVVGGEWLVNRWAALRQETCFRGHISEFTIHEIQETRTRIDSLANPGDFKRGRGGIRDVEFLIQMLQLIHGARFDALRGLGTLEMLSAAEQLNLLPQYQAEVLRHSYIWLRQLEHRCQLVHNQQTHELPDNRLEVSIIGKSLGIGVSADLRLEEIRREVAEIYSGVSTRGLGQISLEQVQPLNRFLGFAISDEELLSICSENVSSFDRLHTIVEHAPLLEHVFQAHWAVGESLLSGEIEEHDDSPPTQMSTCLSDWASCWSRFVLRDESGADDWNRKFREYLWVHARNLNQPEEIGILLLGSAGSGLMGPASDCDLVFFCDDEFPQHVAEQWASEFVRSFPRVPVEIDLRLRPDGGKGLLVRSVRAFKHYAESNLEPWERYMLGFRHWLTVPSDELVRAIDSLDALPWLKQQEDELFAIKQRVELERLKFPTRDIKLGPGGLMDLQWVYRVSELRGIEPPDLTDEGAFLRRLRNRLHLLKLGDLMPVEGSEELERLEIGIDEKNLVQKLADLRHNVRTSFETLRRI